MNKYIVTLTASLFLLGCQQEPSATAEKETEVTKTEAVAATGVIAEKDKMAYAIGTNLADSVSGINKEFKALSMDMEIVKQGFTERLSGQSKLTDEEIAQQFEIFKQKMQFAQQQKQEEMKAAKLAESTAYMAENLTKGFTQTESGLQYKVLTAGKEDAPKPAATDTVKVHYHGTFTDGNVFDSSVDRGEPATFPLNAVIKGWTEGLQLMTVGSKFQFVIPPELGYGFNDSRSIPGGSVLTFEVELLEIMPSAEKSK